MKIINAQTVQEIVNIKDIISAMKEAFRMQKQGGYDMPPRVALDYRENNTLLLMPCFKNDYFATKLITIFPDNASHGEAVTLAAIVLNDGATGKPLAFMDGSIVTALRTGSVGACGAAALSAGEADSVGLVGCGRQGLFQILALSELRELKTVRFFDQSEQAMEKFAGQLSALKPHLQLVACQSSAGVLENTQIVICTTTSQKPVLPDEPQLLKDKTFIGIGAFKPDMRELPDSVFALATEVFVDTEHAVAESGELADPLQRGLLKKENIRLLAEIIDNPPLPPEKGGIRVFKSVGISLFDLQAAELIYKQALAVGGGLDIEL